MKDLIGIALGAAPAMACIAAAVYLASTGSEGWGWFLFVGLLVAPSRIKMD